MTSYLLAGPAGEPISLAEAKAFLKIDDEAEDDLITTLIRAARLHCESVTGLALMAQSWRLVRDEWPADGVVRLPVRPLLSLTGIICHDEAGLPHPLVGAEVLTAPDRLVLPRAVVEGVPRRPVLGIDIDYVAGFGTQPDDVPVDLRQALMVLVGHWYENRTAVVVAGTGAVVPHGFDALLAPYRRVSL